VGGLSELEERIDAAVCEMYGVARSRGGVVAAGRKKAGNKPGGFDRLELARRWISFALGTRLGRWNGERFVSRGVPGMVCLEPGDVGGDGVVEALEMLVGARGAREIGDVAGGAASFLRTGFAGWHDRLYEGRPVFWAFGGGGRVCIVRHDAECECVRRAIAAVGGEAPSDWRPLADDGILINLAPLRRWVCDAALRKSLEKVAADLAGGRYRFAGSYAGRGPEGVAAGAI
jgi:hypothetical protein